MSKKMDEFIELMNILKGKSEVEEKVKKSDKKIIISIDENVTDSLGCIGVELRNVDRGSDCCLAAASLIATCLEHAKKGKEAETITLILMLALEVFSHANTPEEVKEHEEDDLKKLQDFFEMINGKAEEKEEE